MSQSAENEMVELARRLGGTLVLDDLAQAVLDAEYELRRRSGRYPPP
jgi:hypothetical protein